MRAIMGLLLASVLSVSSFAQGPGKKPVDNKTTQARANNEGKPGSRSGRGFTLNANPQHSGRLKADEKGDYEPRTLSSSKNANPQHAARPNAHEKGDEARTPGHYHLYY